MFKKISGSIIALGLTLGILSQYSPAIAALQTTQQSRKTSIPSYSLYQVTLGMSSTDVLKKLGTPARKDPSHIGVEWWIYNKDLQNYLQVGIQNNKVVTMFSNGSRVNIKGVTYGTTTATLSKLWGVPKNTLAITPSLQITNNLLEDHPSYLYNNQIYTFSIDKLDGKKVVGVRISTPEHFSSIALGLMYPIRYSKLPASLPTLHAQQLKAVATAYEKENFDLTNSARVRAKLPLLTWNNQVAAVARSHSMDMAVHHFFNHMSPTKGSPFDRLEKTGIPLKLAGENIASRQLDGVEVHLAWMNSAGHRKNIMNPGFKELGVGTVLTPENKNIYTYYSQNFITKQ